MIDSKRHKKKYLKHFVLMLPLLGLFFIASASTNTLVCNNLSGKEIVSKISYYKIAKVKEKKTPLKKQTRKKKKPLAVIQELQLYIPFFCNYSECFFLSDQTRLSINKENVISFSNFYKTLFKASISVHAP